MPLEGQQNFHDRKGLSFESKEESKEKQHSALKTKKFLKALLYGTHIAAPVD